MKAFFKNLWKDESGQGATEYILILVVVAAIVFAFKGKIVGMIETKTDDLGGKLNEVFGG